MQATRAREIYIFEICFKRKSFANCINNNIANQSSAQALFDISARVERANENLSKRFNYVYMRHIMYVTILHQHVCLTRVLILKSEIRIERYVKNMKFDWANSFIWSNAPHSLSICHFVIGRVGSIFPTLISFF